MKLVINIIAILLILVGTVWFLQGVNVLPGSFMSGQAKWAVFGAVAFGVGIGLLAAAKKIGPRPLT